MLPDWGRDWAADLVNIAAFQWYVPSGTNLFELPGGGRIPPTRWGTWILLITPERMVCGEVTTVEYLAWNRAVSAGKKRRERAKRAKAKDVETLA